MDAQPYLRDERRAHSPRHISTTQKENIMEDLKMKIQEIRERQEAIEGYL